MGRGGISIGVYPGLGYDGLYKTINIAPLQRPVQIVRKTISNLDTPYAPYAPYHRYDGLSIPPQKGGEYKEIPNHTYWTYKAYKV